MDKKYLVQYDAVIGRTINEGADQAPVYLTFYSMVEAKSSDDATSKVVQWSDPGFRTKVRNISEVTDALTPGALFEMLDSKTVLSTKPR